MTANVHGSGRTFGGGPDEVDTDSVYLDYHEYLQTKTEGTPTLTRQVTKITRREVIFANDYVLLPSMASRIS